MASRRMGEKNGSRDDRLGEKGTRGGGAGGASVRPGLVEGNRGERLEVGIVDFGKESRRK